MKIKIVVLLFTLLVLIGACVLVLYNQQPVVVQTISPSLNPAPTATQAPQASTTPTPIPTPEPSPEPTPEPPPTPDPVAARLATMSLAEKIGQLFILSCSPTADAITTYMPAGFVLFGRDVADNTPETLLAKIQSLQALSTTPMLMAIDEEGGTVNRLSDYTAYRATPFQSPKDLYAMGGMECILADLAQKAQLLQSVGINVNLAPVADVSTDPADFMYYRSLAMDADTTADYITQVVTTAKTLNLGMALKHFPGYGNNADTHQTTAVDTRTLESLHQTDLVPFAAGIAAGADSILVSHNIVSCLDETAPASFSVPVHALLRGEMGYEGVIMTDDLTMGAAENYGDSNTNALQAILAGNDLVMCGNYQTQIPAAIAAAQDGRIPLEQIDASVRRVLQWKYNLGLLA